MEYVMTVKCSFYLILIFSVFPDWKFIDFFSLCLSTHWIFVPYMQYGRLMSCPPMDVCLDGSLDVCHTLRWMSGCMWLLGLIHCTYFTNSITHQLKSWYSDTDWWLLVWCCVVLCTHICMFMNNNELIYKKKSEIH